MADAGMEKRKRGRPKKSVDLALVEKLAHIQCTHAEIASTLDVSVDTLTRHKEFAATFKRGAEGGRKSLRRMQFESASKGNVVMQIFLGKQYLHQTDRNLTEVRTIRSSADLTDEELEALVASAADAGLLNETRPRALPPATSLSMQSDGVIVDVEREQKPSTDSRGQIPAKEFS